jgi:hypothetical protein
MSAINMLQNRIIDLTNDAATNNVSVPDFSRILTTERLDPACSFCECPGHNIRTCRHPDREKLHECAQFMYLMTCNYLGTHPNTEKTHELWLCSLRISDYKILARLNGLDTNSRTTREEYYEKLHAYYLEYAENVLQNNTSANAISILSFYWSYIPLLRSDHLTDEYSRIYATAKLKIMIINSGRYLMDMPRLRYWLNNHMENYYHYHQPIKDRKQIPTIIHNPSLARGVHDECPICYTEMTNDSMVQLGCCHSFCGDCIIGQIKSSSKPTSECAMCRATISECSSASNELLQKISKDLK